MPVTKQIYGWTEPQIEPGKDYVRYIMAFAAPDGIVISIRNAAGAENEITLSKTDAAQLAATLLAASVY